MRGEAGGRLEGVLRTGQDLTSFMLFELISVTESPPLFVTNRSPPTETMAVGCTKPKLRPDAMALSRPVDVATFATEPPRLRTNR